MSLKNPYDVFVDSTKNVIVADTFNARVRYLDNSNGILTTIIGDGTSVASGDGGPHTSAQIRNPFSVCRDSSGGIYVLGDTENQ